MEIPRVLRRAPPTRPPRAAHIAADDGYVTADLDGSPSVEMWELLLRTRSFALHFAGGLCVVKSSGAVCKGGGEIEHQKKENRKKTRAQTLSPAVAAPFLFCPPPNVGQCQRVWCGSHGRGLSASPPQPRPLIRLQRGGNNICACDRGREGGGGRAVPMVLQLEMIQKD